MYLYASLVRNNSHIVDDNDINVCIEEYDIEGALTHLLELV